MIRLLIAEDHALVRDGLRLMISVQPDMVLAAETDDGESVVPLVMAHRPDVLLLDLGLPRLDGLAVMAALAQAGMPTRVLVVTARIDPDSVRSCLALGAAGYLPKNSDGALLFGAIREVMAGGRPIAPEIARMLESSTADTETGLASLTQREREILAQVGTGRSSKEIARALGISDLTVRKHRENLCRKLGLRNSAELVALAVRQSAV